MKEFVTRIFKVLKRDFDENKVVENDDFILIPKSMLSEEQANYTEALNNFNLKNQLQAISRNLVDEFIRKQKISLTAEKKRYIAKIRKIVRDQENKDAFEKDYLNTEYATKLKAINDMHEKLYKLFDNAINKKYKIDTQKLDINNGKELLKELEYEKSKYDIELTTILLSLIHI